VDVQITATLNQHTGNRNRIFINNLVNH